METFGNFTLAVLSEFQRLLLACQNQSLVKGLCERKLLLLLLVLLLRIIIAMTTIVTL